MILAFDITECAVRAHDAALSTRTKTKDTRTRRKERERRTAPIAIVTAAVEKVKCQLWFLIL